MSPCSKVVPEKVTVTSIGKTTWAYFQSELVVIVCPGSVHCFFLFYFFAILRERGYSTVWMVVFKVFVGCWCYVRVVEQVQLDPK